MSRAASAAASPDVLIVGGGVIAAAIADALASDGARVRLVEAESLGSGASGAAAGMLAPVGEYLLEAGRSSESESETEAAQADGARALQLGLLSLSRFERLCERLSDETGIDPEYRPSGRLDLVAGRAGRAGSAARRQRLELAAARMERLGESANLGEIEPCDRQDIEAIAGPVDASIEAGFFCAREAHVRPPLLVRALAASASARGAQIEAGVRVHGLAWAGDRVLGADTSEGRISAGLTVLAAGAATPGLLGTARARAAGIEIEPVRGQILSLEAPLPPMNALCWSEGIYFVPKRDGSWVVGATEERVGFDRRVTAEGIGGLLGRAAAVFPSLGQATFGSAWAGLRPVSRDGRAFVGAVPGTEGLSLAAGHGRNGVLLAPLTAEVLSDALKGKARSQAARWWSPDRPA